MCVRWQHRLQHERQHEQHKQPQEPDRPTRVGVPQLQQRVIGSGNYQVTGQQLQATYKIPGNLRAGPHLANTVFGQYGATMGRTGVIGIPRHSYLWKSRSCLRRDRMPYGWQR
jgi:hypothetical protein